MVPHPECVLSAGPGGIPSCDMELAGDKPCPATKVAPPPCPPTPHPFSWSQTLLSAQSAPVVPSSPTWRTQVHRAHFTGGKTEAPGDPSYMKG